MCHMNQHDSRQPQDVNDHQTNNRQSTDAESTGRGYASFPGQVVSPGISRQMPTNVLRMQRQLGNKRVGRILSTGSVAIQRVDEVAVEAHSARELLNMDLSTFHNFAQRQVDWFRTSQMTDRQRTRLQTLLRFADQPHALAGGGHIKTSQWLFAGVVSRDGVLDVDKAAAITAYGHAISDSVIQDRSNNPGTILRWGAELVKLYAVPSIAAAMPTAFKQNFLQQLIRTNNVDFLVRYMTTMSPTPILEADNGSDIESFIGLRREGKDPTTYAGTSLQGNIRNFHRFERRALDRLVRNFEQADLPNDQRKPLTLILHTAHDHNGAFHRDPYLTQVIVNNNILAIMIEGKDTLADIQSELPTLAARYGKDSKIDQVMFAGHGNARVIEMGADSGEDINLNSNAADTNALFDELLQHMANDPTVAPHRRIVFNACLTGSNVVTVPLDATEATAQQQVRDHIGGNASLATYLQQRAHAAGLTTIDVRGANGSFSQVELIDSGDGLDIMVGYDPSLTSDKIDYVRDGVDPGGALRAVLECWAGTNSPDPAAAQQTLFTTMEHRVNNPVPANTSWSEKIITTLYSIILNRYRTNGEMIRRMGWTAGGLDHMTARSEARISKLTNAGVVASGHMETEATPIFTALSAEADWQNNNFVQLVGYEAWMRIDNAKRSDFMSTLGNFTAASARDYIDLPYVEPELPQLIPASAASSPTRAQMIVSTLTIVNQATQADAQSFLMAVIGSGNRQFPASLNVGDTLGGNPTEGEVLGALGLLPSAPASPASPQPVTQQANLDLDGDGVNETFVTPRNQQATNPQDVTAFEEPDIYSTAVTPDITAGQTLTVVGESGSFFAIDNPLSGQNVVFVDQADVTLT